MIKIVEIKKNIYNYYEEAMASGKDERLMHSNYSGTFYTSRINEKKFTRCFGRPIISPKTWRSKREIRIREDWLLVRD